MMGRLESVTLASRAKINCSLQTQVNIEQLYGSKAKHSTGLLSVPLAMQWSAEAIKLYVSVAKTGAREVKN